MDSEMKAICSELAKSIQRESNLELVVSRLQEHIVNLQVQSERSSECSSDSGYSSETVSEYDQRRDDIERIQRECGVEKARIRLELVAKLQDERSRREALEQQVEKLASKRHQKRSTPTVSLEDKDCLENLQSTCADLGRRLSEEKQSNSNFQYLLLALQNDLQEICNERDNYKNEVIPQLRAKLESLEAEEHSCISRKAQLQERVHYLFRRSPNQYRLHLPRSSNVGLTSWAPPKDLSAVPKDEDVKGVLYTGEELAAQLHDVEVQRDALHRALKSLLDTQEFQRRESQRRIEHLESARQQLLLVATRGTKKEIPRRLNCFTMTRRGSIPTS